MKRYKTKLANMRRWLNGNSKATAQRRVTSPYSVEMLEPRVLLSADLAGVVPVVPAQSPQQNFTVAQKQSASETSFCRATSGQTASVSQTAAPITSSPVPGAPTTSLNTLTSALTASPAVTLSLVGNPSTGPYTVVAVPSDTRDVQVTVNVDGKGHHLEHATPYSLFDDIGGTPNLGTLGAGTHTVEFVFSLEGTSTEVGRASMVINEGVSTPIQTPTTTPTPTPSVVGSSINVAQAVHDNGNAYWISQNFGTAPDTGTDPTASQLHIYENGRELGPAHSAHADIRTLGNGRFSQWQDGLYFSASDNTNPMANGRSYTFTVGVATVPAPTPSTPTPTPDPIPTPTSPPPGPITQPSTGSSTFFNSSEPGMNGSNPNILLSDDFENGSWYVTNADHMVTANDGWEGTIYAPIVNNGVSNGGVAGSQYSATSGYLDGSRGGQMMAIHDLARSTDDLYFRYYIRTSTDTVWSGEKLLTFNAMGDDGGIRFAGVGAGTSGAGPNNTAAFNTPPVYQDPGWLTQNQGHDLGVAADMHWYYVEVHIKLNTPGQANGVYEVWMDDAGPNGTNPVLGTLRTQYTNVQWRGPGDNTQLGSIWIENWGNNRPGATGDNDGTIGTHWYDNVVASTNRIGPLSA